MKQREKILNKLREYYSEGKMDELERSFTLGSWMLTNEDKQKIKAVINSHKSKISENEKELIKGIQELMGGKII